MECWSRARNSKKRARSLTNTVRRAPQMDALLFTNRTQMDVYIFGTLRLYKHELSNEDQGQNKLSGALEPNPQHCELPTLHWLIRHSTRECITRSCMSNQKKLLGHQEQSIFRSRRNVIRIPVASHKNLQGRAPTPAYYRKTRAFVP